MQGARACSGAQCSTVVKRQLDSDSDGVYLAHRAHDNTTGCVHASLEQHAVECYPFILQRVELIHADDSPWHSLHILWRLHAPKTKSSDAAAAPCDDDIVSIIYVRL
jgi:hypothetical protein